MLENGAVEARDDPHRCEELLHVLEQGSRLTQELRDTLITFSDVFALRGAELTQTDLVVHDIDTGDTPPIRQKTRPVPIGARQEF